MKVSEELQIEPLDFRDEIQNIEKMISEIKQFLWNKERKRLEELLKILIDKYSKEYPVVIEVLTRNKEGLLTYQLDDRIAKTNNDAENTNSQIKKRLKTIKAFQSWKNAENY